MANRYLQQFFYSFIRNLTSINGSISMVPQTQATLVNQGLTYTSVPYGTVGNSTTVTLAAGGTAGAEVVTVSGADISVSIQDGTSTANQVKTAINASTAAVALVTMTGSGTVGINALTKTALSGGTDGVSTYSMPGVASVVQTAVGEVTITLTDKWPTLVFPEAQILKAVAQDLVPQFKSVNLTTKAIVLNILAGATKTDPTAAMTLYVNLMFKNSSVTY